jgi:outer membrane receptor for ferrienterochelin and colicins
MKMKAIGLGVSMVAFGLSFSTAFSQSSSDTDSLKVQQLDEVVVTATRNERTVGSLPMPVTLIKKDLIKTMGSVRLNDILTEQTGLVVVPQVNGQGNGIQIQGFNPDYTLILVDGEPIIGRYTGSLELSRLTVGNIKQVEIVKGPSSSLYGSDALAGVINIITERPKSNQGNFSVRYGANSTLDLNGSGSMTKKNLGVYLFANRYSTDGYDLSPENYGKTVSPFRNITVGTKITYQLSKKTELSVGGRYFDEKQDYSFDVLTNGSSVRTFGDGIVKDWNLNPVITHHFSSSLKATGRFYTTQYSTNTLLRRAMDDSVTYTDNFLQSFTRYEANAEYFFNERNIMTVGAGHIEEGVTTSRYNDQRERRQQTDYAFAQYEWSPLKSITIIPGLRYDLNSIYGYQFSPKLSARFELNSRISFKGSFGFGFKSPDFRQLYFNFNNQAGGGYSVLGTEIIKEKLADFQAQGLIQSYLFDPFLLGKLKAESSMAINIGGRAEVLPKLMLDFNFFRNTIDNLIESQLVAINTSGQSIYSYRNIQRALMQGAETDLSYPMNDKFSLSLGYQLLYAKDRDVIDKVDNGEVFWRDPNTLATQRLKSSEYFGLYNRSRHTGNFKIFYRDIEKGWEASLRVIYRGKFGLGGIVGNIQGETAASSDRNNNAILDVYDHFVSGYALTNVSIAKTLRNVLRIQLGIDNVFDYTDPITIPNLPGRLSYVSISYSILKQNNKNH